MQAYLDGFGRAWSPRCEPRNHFGKHIRDSPSKRTALLCRQSNEGSERDVAEIDLGERSGDWAVSLR